MNQYEHFEIDLNNPESTHTKIVNLIERNSKVLDVGCNAGYLAAVMKEHFGCEVVGIELVHEVAQKAKAHCCKVIEGDIESLDFEASLGKDEFDVIVFADVLEHLKDPEAVLKKLKSYCKGYIVISVPNISHAAVVNELLQGEFNYRQLGLLDSTHVKFFTKKTIVELIEKCGFVVESIDTTRIKPENTEFHTAKNGIPTEVFDFINSREEAWSYQYVIRAYNPISSGITQSVVKQNATIKDLREHLESEQKRNEYLEVELSELENLRESVQRLSEQNGKLEEFIQQLSEDKQQLGEHKQQLTEHKQQLSELLSQREAQLLKREEEILWYAEKLREQLILHYRHFGEERALRESQEAVNKRSADMGTQIEQIKKEDALLREELRRSTSEVLRLQQYSLDYWPRFLKLPLKTCVAMINNGPLEPLRIWKKKRLTRSSLHV